MCQALCSFAGGVVVYTFSKITDKDIVRCHIARSAVTAINRYPIHATPQLDSGRLVRVLLGLLHTMLDSASLEGLPAPDIARLVLSMSADTFEHVERAYNKVSQASGCPIFR